MHNRENPLRVRHSVYYGLDPWGLEEEEVGSSEKVKLDVEVIIVPAGAHYKKLKIEFVNITTPFVLGKPVPSRPKTKEQTTYLLEFVNKFIERYAVCSCCGGRELLPITMHSVCWNNE